MASNRKRRNGDGTIYPYGEDRFRASLPMPDGSRRTRVHPTYSKAEAWLVEERSKRDQGVQEWSSSKMPTLGEWWDLWLEVNSDRLKRRTVESYKAVKSRYVSASLAKRPLNEVGPLDIERLYSDLARKPKVGGEEGETLSRSTVHQVHRVLRACMKAAFRKGIIGQDPMARVTPPPRGKAQDDSLSLQEVQAVLKAAEGHTLEALWTIVLTLGLRQGESLGLKWQDVDWNRQTLRVERQVHRSKGGWLFESTKEEDVRVLPLDERTLALLRKHKAAQSQQRLAAGTRWVDYDCIFTTSVGTPIDERNDRKNWHALLEKAGVRRVRRHDARHTAGTLHYAATRDAKHVQTILGHADPAFTVSVYVHADAKALRAGQDAVAGAIYADITG